PVAAGVRGGRRPPVRPPPHPPHRRRPGDAARPLRDRELVLRAVDLPAHVDPAGRLTCNAPTARPRPGPLMSRGQARILRPVIASLDVDWAGRAATLVARRAELLHGRAG